MRTAPAVLAALFLAAAASAAPAPAVPPAPSATPKPAASSAPRLTKAEVRAFLKKNPDVLLEALKDNRKAVFDIVEQAAQEAQMARQQEQEEAAKKDFEDSLKNPKKAEITDKTRIRGNKDAKYTLVEYSDFQCPYCARGFQTVEILRKKYGANLRFIYKNLPLPMHAQAMPAAQWLEAVAIQSPDKAWEFHDKMFQNQDKLGADFFKETVKGLGLDVAKAEQDAKSTAVSDKIDADMKEGKGFGFDGTPGFLFNGVPVRGAYPPSYFDMIISRLEGKPVQQDSAE
jgi:protein-disulfide isomerase